jgi:hypothetical protein
MWRKAPPEGVVGGFVGKDEGASFRFHAPPVKLLFTCTPAAWITLSRFGTIPAIL